MIDCPWDVDYSFMVLNIKALSKVFRFSNHMNNYLKSSVPSDAGA